MSHPRARSYPGPSVAKILADLGRTFEHDGWDPTEAALVLKAAMGSTLTAHEILEFGNELLGGHGIEYLRGNPGLDYVNMGDTYNTTLCFDHKTKRFIVSDWGTIVERSPKRFD